MNKRQKEVIEQTLKDEQQILKNLEKNYTATLADIKKNIQILQSNELTQSKIYQIEFQEQLGKQISGAIDLLNGKNFTSVAEYLNLSYETGFIGSMYDLQGQGIPLVLPLDQKQIIKTVSKTGDSFKLSKKLGDSDNYKKTVQEELSRGLASSRSYADIARNISNYTESDMKRAFTIARTEGHRVRGEAGMDALQAVKKKGADVVKQWDSTLVGETRENHRQLDGQIREIEDPFEIGGITTMHPGGFGNPAEDCNCRCTMLQRARWAIEDEDTYTKWDNENKQLIECSGYGEFKEKYLAESDKIAKGNAGAVEELGKLDDLSLDSIISKLKEHENIIRDSDVENAIVITRNGNILKLSGDKNKVDITTLGEKLKGSYVTHNHPEGSNNEYSFSNDDINAFAKHKLDTLRGFDAKYTYELDHDAENIDKSKSLLSLTEEDFRHEKVIMIAKENGLGYRRMRND